MPRHMRAPGRTAQARQGGEPHDPAGWRSSRLLGLRGTVPLPPGCDEARLLPHVLADLRRRGCPGHLADPGTLLVEGRSEARYSILAFVDAGRIALSGAPGQRVLRYRFSTLGGLQLCAALSLVAAALGWFALDSPELAAFGLLAPLFWLYGANLVISAFRVPALLDRLCRSAPTRAPGPWG